jgi:hypothetical protein
LQGRAGMQRRWIQGTPPAVISAAHRRSDPNEHSWQPLANGLGGGFRPLSDRWANRKRTAGHSTEPRNDGSRWEIGLEGWHRGGRVPIHPTLLSGPANRNPGAAFACSRCFYTIKFGSFGQNCQLIPPIFLVAPEPSHSTSTRSNAWWRVILCKPKAVGDVERFAPSVRIRVLYPEAPDHQEPRGGSRHRCDLDAWPQSDCWGP